jgi:flagellar motor switch protein FliN/FliY
MDDTILPSAGQDGTSNPILGQVPIEITVSVGFARPMVKELMNLRRDAVLPLDRRIDDPVELYIGDKLIARGELQELEGDQAGYLGVRLTEIANLDAML